VTSDGEDPDEGDAVDTRGRRKVVPFRPRRDTPLPPATVSGHDLVERGRRVGGVGGAMMAGVMVALTEIYERPKRDDGAVVVDAPDEPLDAHRDGMQFEADEIGGDADVEIAALERRDPLPAPRRSRLLRRPRH